MTGELGSSLEQTERYEPAAASATTENEAFALSPSGDPKFLAVKWFGAVSNPLIASKEFEAPEIKPAESAASPTEVAQVRRPLRQLPTARRIAVNFEPHLRSEVIRSVRSRVGDVKSLLGKPGIAIAVVSLKRDLAEAYRATYDREDTEYLAVVVSALQDYLAQHWSAMAKEDLEKVDELFGQIAKQKKPLSAALASKLIGKIASLKSGALELPIPDDHAWPDEI